MYTRFSIFSAIAIVALLFFTLQYSYFPSRHVAHPNAPLRDLQTEEFPHKIWQKWEFPPQGLGEELMRLSKSWIDMNPSFRYELLTSESSLSYVRDRFRERPDIVRVFEQTTDGILRADLVRYLTLLADGGVYADIDTDCSKPISHWVPPEYIDRTNLLLGIEYDARGGEIRKDFNIPTQLCQWTLMAKPGHPVLQHVVDRVIAKLEADSEETVNSTSHDLLYVLETSGPRMFTKAVLESLTAQIGRSITYDDISDLDEPKLLGDVLILPISAFASGQDHSGSKPWGNDEQLMSHHFLGFQGWKANHQRRGSVVR